MIFATLEDETGFANLVLWPNRFEQFRAAVMTARLLAATGTLQREGRVIHVIAERLTDLTPSLRRLRDHAIDPKLSTAPCPAPTSSSASRATSGTRCRRGGTSGEQDVGAVATGMTTTRSSWLVTRSLPNSP